MDTYRQELLLIMEQRLQDGRAIHVDQAFRQSFEEVFGQVAGPCRLLTILPEFRKYDDGSYYMWPLADWEAIVKTIQLIRSLHA